MLIWYVVNIPASLGDNGEMLHFRDLGWDLWFSWCKSTVTLLFVWLIQVFICGTVHGQTSLFCFNEFGKTSQILTADPWFLHPLGSTDWHRYVRNEDLAPCNFFFCTSVNYFFLMLGSVDVRSIYTHWATWVCLYTKKMINWCQMDTLAVSFETAIL